MTNELQPHLLRVAREAAGLTQGDVVRRLGVTQVTVSRWENGVRSPDKEDVERLASLYGVRSTLFFDHARAAGLVAGDLHYRRRARVKVSDVKLLEAKTNLLRLGVHRLLNEVDVDSPYEIPELPHDEFSPEDAARQVRAYWSIPIGPIYNLTELLEMAGTIVILSNFPADGLDGVSMWAGPWPLMHLSRLAPIDRRRWTMAHELGHLVMHRLTYSDTSGEAQADQFAAEFLMPADQIRPKLRRLTLRRAADLKLEWGVSISAIIQHAKRLKAITPQEATRLHKERSRRRWTKFEPLSDLLPEEKPTTISAVCDSLRRVGYQSDDLARLLHLRDLSDHPLFEPQLKLVQ